MKVEYITTGLPVPPFAQVGRVAVLSIGDAQLETASVG